MDDLIASILILLTVSPAIVVLLVLVARGVRNIWAACVLAPESKLDDATEASIQFHGKLCGARS